MGKISFQSIDTEFSPSEVEAITGLSLVAQRDWRRRGYLKSQSGKHAKFTAIDVAKIMVMKTLADRGIGPAHGHVIAHVAALRVYRFALAWPKAVFYSGTAEDIAKAQALFARMGRDRRDFLVTLSVPSEGKYLVVFGPDRDLVTDDLHDVFDRYGSQHQDHDRLVAIVLSLENIGDRLAETAGKPMVTVLVTSGDEP